MDRVQFRRERGIAEEIPADERTQIRHGRRDMGLKIGRVPGPQRRTSLPGSRPPESFQYSSATTGPGATSFSAPASSIAASSGSCMSQCPCTFATGGIAPVL